MLLTPTGTHWPGDVLQFGKASRGRRLAVALIAGSALAATSAAAQTVSAVKTPEKPQASLSQPKDPDAFRLNQVNKKGGQCDPGRARNFDHDLEFVSASGGFASRNNPPYEPVYVLHETVINFEDSLRVLSRGGKVSTHALVGINGRRVHITPAHLSAWTVGESAFNRDKRGQQESMNGSINRFAYSIEMVTDPKCIGTYTYAQLKTAAYYAVKLQVKKDRIVTHKEVSYSGKQDPRGLDLKDRSLNTPGGIFWFYYNKWRTENKNDVGQPISLCIPKDPC